MIKKPNSRSIRTSHQWNWNHVQIYYCSKVISSISCNIDFTTHFVVIVYTWYRWYYFTTVIYLYVISVPLMTCSDWPWVFFFYHLENEYFLWCSLFVFACLWFSTYIVLCFYFVFLRLVYPMLPVSLNCPFLIAPSVFSNV
jgi:hypothetical protein